MFVYHVLFIYKMQTQTYVSTGMCIYTYGRMGVCLQMHFITFCVCFDSKRSVSYLELIAKKRQTFTWFYRNFSLSRSRFSPFVESVCVMSCVRRTNVCVLYTIHIINFLLKWKMAQKRDFPNTIHFHLHFLSYTYVRRVRHVPYVPCLAYHCFLFNLPCA